MPISSNKIKLRFFPKRQLVRRPLIGDMRHYIALQTRTITTTDLNNVDIDETFVTTNNVFASIITKQGIETFDSTNQVYKFDTIFIIRFIDGLIPYTPGITAEKWIEYLGVRYDIITIESYDDRQTWMLLKCNTRGDTAKQVNKA